MKNQDMTGPARMDTRCGTIRACRIRKQKKVAYHRIRGIYLNVRPEKTGTRGQSLLNTKQDLEGMNPIDKVQDHDSPHVTDNSLFSAMRIGSIVFEGSQCPD